MIPAAASNGVGRAAPPFAVNRFFEFSLLAMLSCGYVAVLLTGFLDPPTAIVAACALVVRGLLAAGFVQFHISSRWTNTLAVVYLGFFPLDVYYVSGSFLAAVVHSVFFLAVLKLLTSSTERDFGHLKIIAGLEMISAAILSAGLSFLLLFSVFLLAAVATFASSEVRRGTVGAVTVSRNGMRFFTRRLSLLVAFLFVGIVLISAGMFLVLPRTARAAFERFIPQRYHMTGFSNSVNLGEIGELQQSSMAVLHVRSYRERPLPAVKWRGSALSQFDGTRWFNPPYEDRIVPVPGGVVAVRSAVLGQRQGYELVYRVRVEAIAADTLFIAGQPETITVDVPRLRFGPGGSFHVLPRDGGRALNYGVRAFVPDEWAEVRFTSSPLAGRAREEVLTLPTLDPRIPALAKQMTTGATNDIEQARALEKHLRTDFGYTLQLPSKTVPDPLAHFLFERKKGHCEYFASSMAVMLRTLGIPSRVVTGFQSGVYNPMTGWSVIRASDAHSWVEAWLDGRGWTTFDPTPFATGSSAPTLWTKLSLIEDAAAQYWQDWVMSYDLTRQVGLASRMQASSRRLRLPDFEDWAKSLKRASHTAMPYLPYMAGLACAIAIAFIWGPGWLAWWRRRARVRRMVQGHGDKSDATILYEQMLATLRRRGVQKPPWMTPIEFARSLPQSEVSALVEDATGAYNELRFGGRAEAVSRFVDALEQLQHR